MKKNKITTLLLLIVSFSLIICACHRETDNTDMVIKDDKYYEQMENASTTPYGKYPELITYSLGKLAGSNNSNLPEGETYENNAYTKFLRDMLNIQNEDVFEERDDQYNTSVSMAISSGNIPDIMVVSKYEDLQLLVEYGLVADLTDSFSNCMSDTIKDIYGSYDESIMDTVTFDGKIMAIPETNIEDGPNLVWLRKDWMDELGLEDPKNIYDVENIVSQFILKDPGNNGSNNTVGLVCDPSMCGECGYSSEYLLDVIFATYGAYPKQWIRDEDGNIVYGSVQPEAKEALTHIRQLYEEGILDNNFILRTNNNIIELITNGQCGSFFGPWWAPNNPLMNAVSNNPDAEWKPYLIATNEDGSTSFYSNNPSYKYVVVSKKFEHPEIACKIVSVLFDYIRYNESDNKDFINYYQNNVDPTARPLAINVDFSNALSICFDEISSALSGKINPDELNILEYSYYDACNTYLNDVSEATPEEWAAYTSRITACKLLAEGDIRKVQSLYFNETPSMSNSWWKLKKLESETYLQIVTGEASVDSFDDFVTEWNNDGGNIITKEVSDIVNNK